MLIEVLSSWKPDYGRDANGNWVSGYSVASTYSNVVHMVFYHGITGLGSTNCAGYLDANNPYHAYFQHYDGYETYAIEQYMDQQHGILQMTVLFDETGWFGGCASGPATVANANVGAALSSLRSYIDN